MAQPPTATGGESAPRINLLKDLNDIQDCLSEVSGTLAEKRKSYTYVTRFPEQNLLVHRCINFYDNWVKHNKMYLHKICKPQSEPNIHPDQSDRCSRLTSIFEKKNTILKQTMNGLYAESSADEANSFLDLLNKVSNGMQPEPDDPFEKYADKIKPSK